MAKHNKFKKTLFFIASNAATEAEIEASMEFEPGVQFRCAALHRDDAALEAFDRVEGAVPDRYRAAADAKAGKPPVDATDAPAGTGGGAAAPTGAVKPPVPNAGAGWARNS